MNNFYNQDAEQYVLSALLFNNNSIDKIQGLEEKHFYLQTHRDIYRTATTLISNSKPADVLTISDADKSINLQYLHDLSHQAYTSANIEYHAEIVKAGYLKREIQKAAHELMADVNHAKPEQAIQNALIRLDDLTRSSDKKEPRRLSEIALEVITHIDDVMHNNKHDFVLKTGLADLDRILNGGVRGGDLVIIAGRPSMGKTALIGTICQNNIREQSGGISSIEMSAYQMASRFLSGLGGIDSGKLLNSNLGDDDWPKVTHAVKSLQDANIFICDQSSVSLIDLQSKIRELKRKHDIKYYFVDYLQIMDLGDAENLNREIGKVTRGLKILAKELDIPIFVLSQFNRGANQRADQKPRLADLRDSGSIEQDADVVIAPHRDLMDDSKPTEMLVLKNRHGATGSIYVTYRGSHFRFENFVGEIPVEQPKQRGFRAKPY